MAIHALISHKLRSSLTLLGILVGIFSIIVVMTAMRALQSYIEGEIAALGANTMLVKKFPSMDFSGPEGWMKYARRLDLDYDVYNKLKFKALFIPEIKSLGASGNFHTDEMSSRYDTTNPDIHMNGVTSAAFSAKNWVVEEGRAIMDSDVDSHRTVCVLGNDLAKRLFPNTSALREKVRYNSISYTVVGVLKKKGQMMGATTDNYFIVPITTAMNYYGQRRSLDILAESYDRDSFENMQEQVRGALRTIRKVKPLEDDDFEIETSDSLIKQFHKVTLSIRIGIVVISCLALLAAGVGIMNIMLVSVTERTREIGVRCAIGAKKRDIMIQFIMESVVLCQIGGVLGVITGVVGGNLVAKFLTIPMTLPVDWVIIGLVTCSAVGIIFGAYPAYKAANLDPIESLRHE